MSFWYNGQAVAKLTCNCIEITWEINFNNLSNDSLSFLLVGCCNNILEIGLILKSAATSTIYQRFGQVDYKETGCKFAIRYHAHFYRVFLLALFFTSKV